MTSLEERKTSHQDMMRRVRAMLAKYKGARISVSGGTDISGASTGGNQGGGRGGGGGGGGGSSNRLQILIHGPDIEQLQGYATQLMEKVRTINGVVDADSNFEATQPELQVTVDRARAADLGVNIDSLATNLRTLVGGEEVSEFKDGDDQIIVRLRLDEPYRNNPAAMGDLLVPAGPGRIVKVSDVAILKAERGPASIERYNRQRQISVQANIDRVPLEVLRRPLKVEELHLKAGYQAVRGSADLNEASNSFVVAIVLSVAFIYMVLASQFNSFVHPLTIATRCRWPAGWAARADGLRHDTQRLQRHRPDVVRHREEELDPAGGLHQHLAGAGDGAARSADRRRGCGRSMTTIAIVAGMIPIALGGAPARFAASMAITILGGQVLCVLTLLVTPVVPTSTICASGVHSRDPPDAAAEDSRTPKPAGSDSRN